MTPCALYRAFDVNDELLYVGVSLNPLARFMQHAGDKDWWLDVVSIRVESLEDREAALEAESKAIKDENPRHNVSRRLHVAVDPGVIEQRRKQRDLERARRDSLFHVQDGAVTCRECGFRPFQLPKGKPVQGGLCPRCENPALTLTVSVLSKERAA